MSTVIYFVSILSSNLNPLNLNKPKSFLMFSGSIEKQHRAVIGQAKTEIHYRYSKEFSKMMSL